MKTDIILSGVGGQGILSIATILGEAALNNGFFIKQAEVHGMSQRGGDVHSDFRISSEPIFSDIIEKGCADIILSLEPMEALRFAEYLKPDGWIITNSSPFMNIPDYPDIKNILADLKKYKNNIILDIDSMAKEANMPKAGNIILLGAASKFINLSTKQIEDGIKDVFSRKGSKIVNMNLEAFQIGRESAK